MMDVKVSETHRLHLQATVVFDPPLLMEETIRGKRRFNRETREYTHGKDTVKRKEITSVVFVTTYNVVEGTTSHIDAHLKAHNLRKDGSVGVSVRIWGYAMTPEVKAAINTERDSAKAHFHEAIKKFLDTKGLS